MQDRGKLSHLHVEFISTLRALILPFKYDKNSREKNIHNEQ